MVTAVDTVRAEAAPVARLEPVAGGLWFDWVAVALAGWLIGGLHLDGWAHNHHPEMESFFTPWHGVLYSGFFALFGVAPGVKGLFSQPPRGQHFHHDIRMVNPAPADAPGERQGRPFTTLALDDEVPRRPGITPTVRCLAHLVVPLDAFDHVYHPIPLSPPKRYYG